MADRYIPTLAGRELVNSRYRYSLSHKPQKVTGFQLTHCSQWVTALWAENGPTDEPRPPQLFSGAADALSYRVIGNTVFLGEVDNAATVQVLVSEQNLIPFFAAEIRA